mgnify:CR=1 FL=1
MGASGNGLPSFSPIAQAEPAPLSLLAWASIIGLLLGLLAPVTSQEGIDGSLVLAGIVDYPPQSPSNLYFLGSWTIIHQLGALLLSAGLEQGYVSEVLFLVPCALFVAAFSAIIYCFTGQFFLSLMAAALFYLANPLAKYFASPDYMMVGLPWSHPPDQTFGLWAHAGAVWVIGCVAAGRKALAGFSALVLIAVHPVVGAYLVLLLIGTLLAGKLFFGTKIGGFAKGAAWGAAITLLSFVFYLRTRPDLSGTVDWTAYDAYMSAWDTHRSHLMTASIAARIAIAATFAIGALSVFLILARPRRDAALLSAIMVLLAVAISTIAYFMAHLAPQLLPDLVMRAAPGRLLNVQAFLGTPLALALGLQAASHATRDWTSGTTAAWIDRALPGAALAVVIVELAIALHSRQTLMRDDIRTLIETRGLAAPSAAGKDSLSFWRKVRTSGITGQVLTTRASSRPALIYGHLPVALTVGAFDYVPYIPRTAGAVARIIEEGYGISFSDPPPDMRHSGALPSEAGKAYWAQLAPDDWCRLSRSLGVVAVVAPSDWIVKLPQAVAETDFTLYKITCD